MTLKKNLILILITSVVFSSLLVRYVDRVPKRHYCDFRVYYKAGQDILMGKDIYFREKEEITPYKYSPFFAFVFSPLSFLPIKEAASVFFALNFFLTILFFTSSFDLFNDPVLPLAGKRRFWVYLLVFLCVLQYIFLVWDSGQVNILMCVLVLLGLKFSSKGQDAGAGAFLAGAILIKYMPAIFLPYLILQKRYKTVLWAVFFAGAFLMLPALMVGGHKNFLYLSSWFPSIIGTSLDPFSYISWKNQSIFSMAVRFFFPTMYHVQIFSLNFHQVLRLGYLSALCLYAAVFLPGRSSAERGKIDYALLFICLALFNPNGWYINFIALLVPYMLLFSYLFRSIKRDWFILLCLTVCFVLINLIASDITGRAMENFAGIYSFTTWGALILYMALIKLKFFTIEH